MTPARAPVYLDHNATTPVRPEVIDAMLPYLREHFGNPNSIYSLGQRARKGVEQARAQVAAFVGAADPQEIVFTAGGSEADVLGVSGAAWQSFEETKGARNRIVASPLEHDAIRLKLSSLARRGFDIKLCEVDGNGVVKLDSLKALVDDKTALVTVMHANNEVGTIQPIADVAHCARAHGALAHTDAVQSAGKLPIDVKALGVDLLSLSGHKLNAPKGVGALYVRKGVRLKPVVTGHQEKNRRGGTENVAAIVGFGAACELAAKDLPKAQAYADLRRRLEEGVLKIAGSRVNGAGAARLPNVAHFSFDGLDGHQLVVALDLEGVCVSAGPACSSGASMASHVLLAMGCDERLATGSIRVSMGWGTTAADVDRLLEILPAAVSKLRKVQAVSL